MSTVTQIRLRGSFRIIAGFAVTLVAGAQGTPPSGEAVTVNEAWPLARAAYVLQSRYGVPVSYEEAEYKFSGDVDHSRAGLVIPRAGTLTVDLSPPAASAEPLTVAKLLQGLLEQNVRNGNPGQFKLIETVAGLGIVPVAVRDSTGALVPCSSPLDVRISFPEMERDASSAIELFLQVTGSASGRKIGLLRDEVSKWKAVRIGANNEMARDVLARLLVGLHSESGPPLQEYKSTWTLVSTGGGVVDYFLSLGQVTIEQAGPGGTVTREAVSR